MLKNFNVKKMINVLFTNAFIKNNNNTKNAIVQNEVLFKIQTKTHLQL